MRGIGVGVREQIKAERVRRRSKRPLERTLFDRIGAIVRRYRLQADFLDSAPEFVPGSLPAGTDVAADAMKQDFAEPLFVLCSAEEYRLVVRIMEKFDNPYLPYANCPEEIALSTVLFEAHPDLDRKLLKRCHFKRLLHDTKCRQPAQGVVR